MSNHSIVINNVTFPTLSAAAKHFNVSRTTALRRLEQGKSPEQAFGVKKVQHSAPHPLDVNGQHFNSISAFAKHYGVASSVVRARLHRGQSISEILNVIQNTQPAQANESHGENRKRQKKLQVRSTEQSPNPTIFKLDGQTFDSIDALAEAYHANPKQVAQRLNAGWSVVQAVGLTPRPSALKGDVDTSPTTLTFNGNTFTSVSALAQAAGVDINALSALLAKGIDSDSAIAQLASTSSTEAAQKPTSTRGHPRAKPITVQGEIYPSERAAAKAFGVAVSTYHSRRRAGVSIEAALGITSSTGGSQGTPATTSEDAKSDTTTRQAHALPVMVNGQRYPSARAAARAFGVNISTYHSRRRAGASAEEALGCATHHSTADSAEKTPAKTGHVQHAIPVTVKGKQYPSARAAARAFGVNISTYHSRCRAGATPEEALGLTASTPRKKNAEKTSTPARGNAKPVTFRGHTYPSQRQLSLNFGIDPRMLHRRLSQGWTLTEALGLTSKKTTPVAASTKKSAQPVHFQKKLYPSVKAFADAFGVNPATVRRRLDQGWTRAEAVGLVERTPTAGSPATQHDNGTAKFTIGKLTFKSVKALAQHFKVSPHKVRYRLQCGWTLHQAVGLSALPELKPKSDTPTRALLNIRDLLPLNVDGQSFNSAAELARHYNLNVARVTGRLRNGWTVTEAVELQPHSLAEHRARKENLAPALNEVAPDRKTKTRSNNAKPVYKKQTYSSYTALCEALNLNYNMIMGRLHRGWSLEEAIEKHTSSRRVDKQVRPEASSQRRQAKVRAQQRMDEFTAPHDIALGKRHFANIMEFASSLSLDPKTVKARLDAGWDPKQVAGKAPPPNWH